MNINYNLLMEEEIKKLNYKPKLLLHACCAPCSSSVLEKLIKYFDITIYYYNPNITDSSEYNNRLNELHKFILDVKENKSVKVIDGEYNINDFYNISKGLENIEEGGIRCYNCYELRLNSTAKYAKENGFDYFTTTLSVSPYKNSKWINEIGEDLSKKYNIKYLYSDFKKKNGYLRSIELSNKYNLYRQDYCGCEYSKNKHIEE